MGLEVGCRQKKLKWAIIVTVREDRASSPFLIELAAREIMKLTSNQIKVLSALQFSARSSVAEIAKATGLTQAAVRHTQNWLIDNKFYEPYACLNVTALGLTDYGINIRHGMSAADRIKFLAFLKRTPQVPWIAEMEGEFQFSFAFLSKSPLELDQFLVSVSKLIELSVEEHTIAPRLNWQLYPHSFLSNSTRLKIPALSWGDPIQLAKIDQDEMEVLKEVSSHPNVPYSVSARKLGIASSTFSYRINSLIKKGVLLGFIGYFNYSALKLRQYRLLIYEKKMEQKFRDAFEQYCALNPRITTCLRVLSQWSYEVDVQISSISDLVELRQAIMEKFKESISSIESMEYIKTYKMGLSENFKL